MAVRRAASAVLAAVALAAAGCGGDDGGSSGDGGKDEAKAQAFRRDSERICQNVVQATATALSDFQDRVNEVARTGDARALREEVLRFVDDLDRAFQPYLDRGRAVLPPEDAQRWRDLNDRAADAFDDLIARVRKAIERTDFASVAGVAELQRQLAELNAGVESISREADAIYRKYGVKDCLSENLSKALREQAAA
jgi:hypothetical protein